MKHGKDRWITEEKELPITSDMAMRVLFSCTDLGDELIKAVLSEDVGEFEGRKEPQKILGNPSRHYVVFDYFRRTSRYYFDLEIQHSPDPKIQRRAFRYLVCLLYSIFRRYGDFKRNGVVIVFLDHWMFDRNLLVKKEYYGEYDFGPGNQIYYVNTNYRGKEMDSYLYRICMDLQRVNREDFRSLKTDILKTVVEYYQEKGGKEKAMKEYMKRREEDVRRGRKEGISEGRDQILSTMCEDPDMTDEKIAKYGKIPVSEVPALRKRLSEAK